MYFDTATEKHQGTQNGEYIIIYLLFTISTSLLYWCCVYNLVGYFISYSQSEHFNIKTHTHKFLFTFFQLV